MKKAVMFLLLAVLAAPLALGDVDALRKTYRDRAAALAADDVQGHYALGLWCESKRLAEEARAQFEKVIALSPDHHGARSALGFVKNDGRWLTREEAMRAKGLVLFEGTWMLPEQMKVLMLPATERERMLAAQKKVKDLLKKMLDGGPKVERFAMKAMEGIADEYKVEPLAYGLRYPSEHVRTFAARELGRLGDRRALRALVHRSLVDPSPVVREAALAAVREFDDPNLLAPYVHAMFSENQALRMNAVNAVGDLGEVIGIEYLIYRLRAYGGGVQRSHIYAANQLSFIQDFDVEVAQTAFIADPIVGILQEGQVLDCRVIGTERTADIVERHVVRRSLGKLAGVDLGRDATADQWAKWWKENKEKLLAKK